jgi:hypothetical protein
MDADNSGLIDFFEFSIAYTYQYEETFGQRALETEIATHFKAICG